MTKVGKRLLSKCKACVSQRAEKHHLAGLEDGEQRRSKKLAWEGELMTLTTDERGRE